MKVKAKCARALIRYLKAKESEREDSKELCTTKLYNATCRQRVCGQNKDNLCLHATRTLIWRSCAFNRGPMTMPVLDGVKPMAITLPICGTSESLFWKRKKSISCWTRSRPTWTFGESDDQVRDKSESKYQRVQDKSETIEKRLRDRTRVLQPYQLVSQRNWHHLLDEKLGFGGTWLLWQNVRSWLHDGCVGDVADRASSGSFRGGHWRYLPIRNHDNRPSADWIMLCPGLSKNSENGNSCPKPHKAARHDWSCGKSGQHWDWDY